MDVRDDVLKALEEARAAKTIGKSLEAKVTVYANEELANLLPAIDSNLAQLFIVSEYEFGGAREQAPENALTLDEVSVVVEKAQGEKCGRCWTISKHVGESEAHPELCPRCAEVVEIEYA